MSGVMHSFRRVFLPPRIRRLRISVEQLKRRADPFAISAVIRTQTMSNSGGAFIEIIYPPTFSPSECFSRPTCKPNFASEVRRMKFHKNELRTPRSMFSLLYSGSAVKLAIKFLKMNLWARKSVLYLARRQPLHATSVHDILRIHVARLKHRLLTAFRAIIL